MASIHKLIRAALESRLATLATANSFPVSYENVSFSPTTGTSYVQCKFIPTQRIRAARGPNAQFRYQGLFSLVVHAPENAGPSAGETLSELIIDNFESNTDVAFTSGGTTINVSLDYAERNQGFLDTPWYYIPITIGWYIYN
tara:strand:+ start:14306 stop:14731 length:426 start_codon:yes stop_codon:yes gene_type:complete